MKKITSILLTLAMILSVVPTFVYADNNSGFTDVNGSEYYAEATIALNELKMLDGYPDGTFGAEKSITRAEMATIICRTIGKEKEAEKATDKTSFDDVKADHWASGYINVAAEEKIISGDGDGKFRPEDNVKYEEAVKMVVCSLGLGDDVNVNPDDWSAEYLKIANEKGITNNLKGSKGNAATRGDIAVMAYNGLTVNLIAPTASKESGNYSGTQKIELSTTTDGAEIYYTTDGTTPTVKSTKYTKAISISKTSTLKAIAVIKNVLVSDVMSVNYTIKNSSGGGGGGGGGGALPSKTYIVSFDLNYNGAPNAPAKQSVKKGGKVTEPSAPIRTNFEFSGWYIDEECTELFDFENTEIQNNVVIYAGWNNLLNYSITDLTLNKETKTVQVLMSAEGNCNLEVIIMDEDMNRTIASQNIAITEACEMANTDVVLPASLNLPSYFVVKANLIDENNNKLCHTYTCINYTQAYEEFLAKTTDDFEAERVLNFDEAKDQNFAVLDDETEVIGSDSEDILDESLSDVDSGIYVLNDNDDTKDLKVGDKILISEDNGYFVTISSIQDEGDKIKIVAEDDYVLSDYFEYIKVDMTTTAGNADVDMSEADEGVTLEPTEEVQLMADIVDIDDELSKSIKFAIAYETDHVNLEGSISGTVKVSVKIHYDAHLFSEDYFECKAVLNTDLEAKAALTFQVEDDETKDVVHDWATLGEVSFPFGITGFSASVKLTFPIDWEISASGIATAKISTQSGFDYSTTSGYRPINKKEFNAEVKIEGTARVAVGPKLAFSVEFLRDVCKLSVAVHAGAEFKATATVPIEQVTNGEYHTCSLCVDGSAEKFATVSLTLTYKITEHIKGTPLDLTLAEYRAHLLDFYVSLINETGQIKAGIGECPFKQAAAKGQLSGYVANADNRNIFIPNATVKIINSNGTTVKTLNTNSSGNYTVTLPEGDYVIHVSASGYMSFECDQKVTANENTYVETLLMIDSSVGNGNGNIGGKIVNSVTGSPIDGATVTIRKGWNKTSGDIVTSTTTNSSGIYNATIPYGNYTVYLEKEGYLSNTINIVSTPQNSTNQGGHMVPENSEVISGGDLRMVLTWGEYPHDLDSHLLGPTEDGSGRFHIYFHNKKYYGSSSSLCADLDLDDITSYGPETTTIYKQNSSGTYSFYIHDYSNAGSSSSTAMSNSGAQIKVYSDDRLVATYNIPTNNVGTLWHVFDYDAATKIITPVNTFSNQSDESYVGSMSMQSDDNLFNDIDIINNDMKKK